MNIRSCLPALCALALLACDDNASPGESPDLGSARDRGVLAPESDMDVTPADMLPPDPDDGVPLLDAEPGEPEPDPGPDPEPAPEPEPGGPCTDGETRACVESCGIATCQGGAFGPCNPAAELCNGHDDNCNGQIDEGYAGLGNGCIADMNGCTSQGTRVCGPDGRSVICDAPPAMPAEEVCDGDDDDCDGRVDENFPGRFCCTDDLQCGPGEVCRDGECAGGVGPGPDPEPDPGPGPGADCLDDFDCGLFEVCVAGECRDFCFTDLDCPIGQACDFGACVPEGPQCVVDADCFGFETCQNGVCAPPQAPPCVEDAECPGAQTCQGGQCALPPGGSSCDAPTVMDAFGQYRGDNTGQFDSFGGNCGPADNGPEQVFVFTLDAPHRVTLHTEGSAFDTLLTVRAACAAGPELACDDDGGAGTASRVTFDAEAGVQYAVAVHGYDDGDVGPLVLDFSGVEVCLVDADCAEGETCQAGACVLPPPPVCGGAIELDGFGAYMGDTSGLRDEVDARCASANEGPEQVYTFQLDLPAEVAFDTGGTAMDTVLSVRTACDDAASELRCDDDGSDLGLASRVEFVAEAGVRYYVIVEGYGAATAGPFVLDFAGEFIVPPPACDDQCQGDCLNAICIPPIPDACAGATRGEAVPGAWQGNTAGLVDQHDAGCANTGAAPDDILVVVFPVDTVVTASTAGSAFDTVLYVLEGCAGEVACNDDSGGLTSEVTFEAEAGVPYYIVVDGYNGASGAFSLSVDVQ